MPRVWLTRNVTSLLDSARAFNFKRSSPGGELEKRMTYYGPGSGFRRFASHRLNK
jgi:hypothetical protein